MPDSSSSSSAVTPTDADRYEDTGTVGSSSTSDGTLVPGKYYRILVPDFSASEGSAMTSYLRLGAVDPSTDGGEDLARLVGLDVDPELHTRGGVRDHTDGNRIVTTLQNKIEVVGGQYRLLVNAGSGTASSSSSPGDDPRWSVPSEPGEPLTEHDHTFVEHVYADTYYDLIATTTILESSSSSGSSSSGSSSSGSAGTGASSGSSAAYAEGRALTSALVAGDFYEYQNGVDVTEVFAASATLTEKLYAGHGVLEVTSTVHATHPDWETINYGPSYTPGSSSSSSSSPPSPSSQSSSPGSSPAAPSLLPGDLVDYVFGQRFIEVIRAGDLMVDKIYGGRLVEVISTTHVNDFAWEVDPGTLRRGDLHEYINGNVVVDILSADRDLSEKFVAANDLTDTMQAPLGTLSEYFVSDGGDVSFTYDAGDSFAETIEADSKVATTTLSVSESAVTLSPSVTGFEHSEMSIDVKGCGLGGDLELSLVLAFALEAKLLHLKVDVGATAKADKLSKSVYLVRGGLGLTYTSTYAQIHLGGGPP